MKTDVIFRKQRGEVFALFPHESEGYFVTFYAHLGQHSAADYDHCIRTSQPANKSDYEPLRAELEGIGYDLNIIKKQNRSKFLKSYYEKH